MPSEENEGQEIKWEWFYYTATVVLKMSEYDFWSCTLKKFNALTDVHFEIENQKNGGPTQENQEECISNIIL